MSESNLTIADFKTAPEDLLTWCLQIDLDSSICDTLVKPWAGLNKYLHDILTHIWIPYSVGEKIVRFLFSGPEKNVTS